MRCDMGKEFSNWYNYDELNVRARTETFTFHTTIRRELPNVSYEIHI